MKVINTYSFKDGEKFLKTNNPKELAEVLASIADLDATTCLTKESAEKTMKGELLFSPRDMNHHLKIALHKKSWTAKADGKKKAYAEPRHAFGGGRFREMDGMKNKVGLEIQFGKYAFMGYDIFFKMIIFKNLGYIECGIEVVPAEELVKQMSTTEQEKTKAQKLRDLFKSNKKEALASIKLRKYRGSKPGPK